MAALSDQGFLDLDDQRLEYRMIGPRPDAAPMLVMLHEGLGCVGMWGDFPDKLQAATGCGVFVYSREGYGQSSPAKLRRVGLSGSRTRTKRPAGCSVTSSVSEPRASFSIGPSRSVRTCTGTPGASDSTPLRP